MILAHTDTRMQMLAFPNQQVFNAIVIKRGNCSIALGLSWLLTLKDGNKVAWINDEEDRAWQHRKLCQTAVCTVLHQTLEEMWFFFSLNLAGGFEKLLEDVQKASGRGLQFGLCDVYICLPDTLYLKHLYTCLVMQISSQLIMIQKLKVLYYLFIK